MEGTAGAIRGRRSGVLRLLIKLPTRQRRDQFFGVLEQYRRMLSGRVPVHFVITCDDDDEQMAAPNIRDHLGRFPNLTTCYGRHRTKVEAVNADIPWPPDWDVLMVASDDMIPVEPGYDYVIAREMEARYPDLDGVLWFDDGYVGRRLNTLPIMGRTYYSRTGYVYHPDYRSLWVDNEFTCVAERLGKQTYIDRVIIRHEHPGNTKTKQRDALYKRNDQEHWRDKALYELRASRGFDL